MLNELYKTYMLKALSFIGAPVLFFIELLAPLFRYGTSPGERSPSQPPKDQPPSGRAIPDPSPKSGR
jgi:hypothetical protein